MPADRLPASGPSVRARLLVAVVAGATVLVLVASAAVLVLLRSQTGAALDDVADARFASLSSAVAAGDTAPVAADPSAQLVTAGGSVVVGSPSLGRASLLDRRRAGAAASGPIEATVERAAGSWRVHAGPVRVGSGQAVLVVAADRGAVARVLERLTVPLAAVAAGLLLATALLAVASVRLALRPVGVMVQRASRASADGDLPVPPGNDEIARLAATLNAVLGRMRASVTRERAFIEGAGHELRTPLAVLHGEVELARTSTSYHHLQESLATAAREVDRLTELTDDLVLVAREGAAVDEMAAVVAGLGGVEPAGSALRPTDLRSLVPAELRRLASLVPRTTLSIDDSGVGGVTALVAGPDSAWQRVLANLVRDAGGAGASEAVVFLSTTADEVFLVLDDDRPAPAPEVVRGGRGLGPAIVDALVRARRGTVVLDRDPGGGARVSVTVPLARAVAQDEEQAVEQV